MGRWFGTDGIRGVANREPMTPERMLRLGRAVAQVRGEGAAGRPVFLVGRDTRRSGAMIDAALSAGICAAGGDVLAGGVLPTPAVSYLTRLHGAAAGLVVSASHNPFEDNGVKVFSGRGTKLPDAEEEAIEAALDAGPAAADAPTGARLGRIEPLTGGASEYAAFCRSTLPEGADLRGMRLVLDAANGALSELAPAVYAGLGADVTCLHNAPDGVNINVDCGSQHTEELRRRVAAQGADAGLAFDGDGDRLIAVDEKGRELSGDHILLICARLYRERGWLDGNLVVSTVMSNFGLTQALKAEGIEHASSAVGDRRVLELMQARGAALGGEASGHLIFMRHHPTGDGVIAGLQLLAALRHYGLPLSELADGMQVVPQELLNVEVSRKPELAGVEAVREAIRAAESQLAGRGRVLVRYSGTQPQCRVMVEGPDPAVTASLCRTVADAVRTALGKAEGHQPLST